MKTFYKNHEETTRAANLFAIENKNSYIEKSSTRCACGQSFAYRVIDSITLDTLALFIECESCLSQEF